MTITSQINPQLLYKFLARSKAYGTLAICREIDSGRNISVFNLEFLEHHIYNKATFLELYSLVIRGSMSIELQFSSRIIRVAPNSPTGRNYILEHGEEWIVTDDDSNTEENFSITSCKTKFITKLKPHLKLLRE